MNRRLLKNRESNRQALTTVFIRMLLTMFFASTYSATAVNGGVFTPPTVTQRVYTRATISESSTKAGPLLFALSPPTSAYFPLPSLYTQLYIEVKSPQILVTSHMVRTVSRRMRSCIRISKKSPAITCIVTHYQLLSPKSPIASMHIVNVPMPHELV